MDILAEVAPIALTTLGFSLTLAKKGITGPTTLFIEQAA